MINLFIVGLFLYFFYPEKRKLILNSTPHIDLTLKNRFKKDKVPDNLDVIIIGSGMGGLIAAAYLSKKGKKVLVLEQHYTAGGCTHNFVLNNMMFDSGLHYISDPVDFGNILDELGDPNILIEWEEMCRTDGIFDLITYDGKSYGFTKEPQFLGKLIGYFPEKEKEFKIYMDLLKGINYYVKFLSILKLLPIAVVEVFITIFRKFGLFDRIIKIATMDAYSVINGIFQDDKITKILTGQYGNLGIKPQLCPFVFHAILVNYYLKGGYYPKGGSRLIAHKLISAIYNNGGQVLVNAKVKRIIVDDGVCVGVNVKNMNIYAKKIVSAIGILNTKKLLLDDMSPIVCKFRQQCEKFKPSISHCTLFCVINSTDDFPDYNNWVINDNSPAFFISFPSEKDSYLRKKYVGRKSCVVIMEEEYGNYSDFINGDKRCNRKEYQQYKEIKSQQILNVLYENYPQLEGKIESYFLGTPLTNKFYIGSENGASYGIEHNMDKLDYRVLRPKTIIKNLYLTGQDITMNGVAGAVGSGILTSYSIMNFL